MTQAVITCFGMRAQPAINNKVNVSNTSHLQWSKQTTTLDFLLSLFYCFNVTSPLIIFRTNAKKI